MVTLLVILYSVSLIRLLTIHRTKSKFERTRLNQVQELEQRLIKVLYDDRMYEERALNELFEDTKRLVKTSDEKYAFTQYMVELLETKQTEGHRVNISNYVTILDVYGIIDFWNKMMSARQPKRRQDAIRMLDDLNIGLSGASIQQSLYHKNNSLRKNARATLMKYDINDPYRFLEEGFDERFNAMDEVRLHYFFSQQHEKNALPQLMRWTNTSNSLYRAFLVREIGFFNQKDSCPALLEMYKVEPSPRVKSEIVTALANMKYEEARQVFIDSFELSGKPVQKAIIMAMSKFEGQDSLDFLVSLYAVTFDSDTKIQLAYAIGAFGDEGKVRLQYAVSDRGEFDRQVYAEVDYQLN